MTLRILDTDHVSLFHRRHPLVVQQMGEFSTDELAVAVITVEEQMRGRLAAIKQSPHVAQQISNYQRLIETVEYFNTIAILPYDLTASARYIDLLAQKIRVGRQDLKIAAIVIAQNAILVTRNQRDFAQIPGLQWEDWTVAPNQ